MIDYREGGSGPPVVFVHGVGVNGDLWRGVAPELASEHRCITPDLPFGAHSRPLREDADLSLPGMARIVADSHRGARPRRRRDRRERHRRRRRPVARWPSPGADLEARAHVVRRVREVPAGPAALPRGGRALGRTDVARRLDRTVQVRAAAPDRVRLDHSDADRRDDHALLHRACAHERRSAPTTWRASCAPSTRATPTRRRIRCAASTSPRSCSGPRTTSSSRASTEDGSRSSCPKAASTRSPTAAPSSRKNSRSGLPRSCATSWPSAGRPQRSADRSDDRQKE